MTDRLKVIEGLDRLLHSGKMYDAHLVIDTCEAAFALLKAQDPRVMTLDEAEKADICWIERRSGIIEACRVAVSPNQKKVTIGRISMSPIHVPLENYGRTWRCWTSRPTDEQWEATPWEHEK